MMDDAMTWLAKMSKLNVYRAKGGLAPHKPLLLLVVCDLIESGDLNSRKLELSPDLSFQFLAYWTIVAHRRTQRPDVRYPFFRLQSDGFWKSFQRDGCRASSHEEAHYAELAPEFAEFLGDPLNRDEARLLLTRKYFLTEECVALRAMLDLPPGNEARLELGDDAVTGASARGREGRFRLTVVSAYGYTCALTRYRLTTIAAGAIVDAAHIHRFADSRNNDPRNGLSLSKNAHWMFDNGLWTLEDDYTVRVATGEFEESCPDGTGLRELAGRKIALPREQHLWPAQDYLEWHRERVFLGSPSRS